MSISFSSFKTPMNQMNGINSDAQLIIRNMNSNGDKTLFMCFPLIVKNPGPSRGAIDSIIRAETQNISQLTVDFNNDIRRNQTSGIKFIEYTSTKGNKATVLMYGNAIEILSLSVRFCSTLCNTQDGIRNANPVKGVIEKLVPVNPLTFLYEPRKNSAASSLSATKSPTSSPSQST